ncbi:hypothetical protein L1887_59567 [Cichorium endivia]|nr:hypothetical protein L1887_59567 [Cichorium endivia]
MERVSAPPSSDPVVRLCVQEGVDVLRAEHSLNFTVDLQNVLRRKAMRRSASSRGRLGEAICKPARNKVAKRRHVGQPLRHAPQLRGFTLKLAAHDSYAHRRAVQTRVGLSELGSQQPFRGCQLLKSQAQSDTQKTHVASPRRSPSLQEVDLPLGNPSPSTRLDSTRLDSKHELFHRQQRACAATLRFGSCTAARFRKRCKDAVVRFAPPPPSHQQCGAHVSSWLQKQKRTSEPTEASHIQESEADAEQHGPTVTR